MIHGSLFYEEKWPRTVEKGTPPPLAVVVWSPSPTPFPHEKKRSSIKKWLPFSVSRNFVVATDDDTTINTITNSTNTRNSITLFCLNPFPNKPWFLHVCRKSLLKTLWEKAKLLVTGNFSFSRIVFLSVWGTFCHLDRTWNCLLQTLFSLVESIICRLGKG